MKFTDAELKMLWSIVEARVQELEHYIDKGARSDDPEDHMNAENCKAALFQIIPIKSKLTDEVVFRGLR